LAAQKSVVKDENLFTQSQRQERWKRGIVYIDLRERDSASDLYRTTANHQHFPGLFPGEGEHGCPDLGSRTRTWGSGHQVRGIRGMPYLVYLGHLAPGRKRFSRKGAASPHDPNHALDGWSAIMKPWKPRNTSEDAIREPGMGPQAFIDGFPDPARGLLFDPTENVLRKTPIG
jgi:hypothetical protein